jgi:uncharacterized membrane protein YpjA
LIPFTVSFLFYRPGGELIIPYSSFKSIILVVGTISGCLLLFQFFKSIHSNFIAAGISVGLCWFIINIILDTLVLIPMMKTTFGDYFMAIGLSYVAMPVISTAMGYSLAKKQRIHEN